jgi:hypothetical protein
MTTSKQASSAEAGQKTIANDAYKAAAGAYASAADIPYVGWIMAPVAGAAAFVAVEAFGSSISAAGGYYQVPGDMMANIHKDEMVLPSWAAKGVRSIIDTGQGGSAAGSGGGSGGGSSGGSGGSGGDSSNSQGSNVSLTYNVQCPDPSAFKGMIAQHADVVYDAVKKSMRSGRR